MRYLITRHAQARANDRSEYPSYDEGLSELGVRQAMALGARLMGRSFDVLIHSGSARTWQSAQHLLPLISVTDVVVDRRTREGEVGEWVGQRASMRTDVARSCHIPVWEVRPPGGESYLDMDARLQPLLADVRSGALGDAVLLVGHGRLNGLAIRALLGTPWDDFEPRQMHHTGVTELNVDRKWVEMLTHDDVSHLPPEEITR